MISHGLVVLVAVLGAAQGSNSFCGADSKQPDNLFSSRTLYEDVSQSQIPSSESQGCSPAALWLLTRHGVSFPNPEELREFARLAELRDRILENHDRWGSGELCLDDLEGLRSWSFQLDIARADGLAPAGGRSVSSLVSRLRGQFSALLHHSQASLHNIRHTTSSSTRDTAHLIASTLYNRSVPLEAVGDFGEWLQSRCPAWIRTEQEATEKANAFRQSPAVRAIVQNVARRFGFSRLDFSLVRDAYKLCSYERALNNKRSPWCSIFSVSELESFDFDEDLWSYNAHGHGNPNAAKVGCSFLRTIIQNFEVYQHNQRVNVQVVNALSLRALLAALGLRSGEPQSPQDSRSWRNSYITPFTANFAAVLHECRSEAASPREFNTVSLYLNEKPLVLPWCDNSHVCEFGRFRQRLAHLTSQSFCNNDYCRA